MKSENPDDAFERLRHEYKQTNDIDALDFIKNVQMFYQNTILGEEKHLKTAAKETPKKHSYLWFQ